MTSLSTFIAKFLPKPTENFYLGKMSIDQRDTIDVMHSKGRRIYYKVTHQGLIKDRKAKMTKQAKCMLGKYVEPFANFSRKALNVTFCFAANFQFLRNFVQRVAILR